MDTPTLLKRAKSRIEDLNEDNDDDDSPLLPLYINSSPRKSSSKYKCKKIFWGCLIIIIGISCLVWVISKVGQQNYTTDYSHGPFVRLATAQGDIVIQLLPEAAPLTVENFLKLVNSGFYTKCNFYRLEPKYIIQGGCNRVHKISPFGPVPLEYSLPNKEGYVGLARSEDPNSGSSEFFIHLKDNTDWLGPGGADKYGYTVFGKVVVGLELIKQFEKDALLITQGGLNMLQRPIEIISATVTT